MSPSFQSGGPCRQGLWSPCPPSFLPPSTHFASLSRGLFFLSVFQDITHMYVRWCEKHLRLWVETAACKVTKIYPNYPFGFAENLVPLRGPFEYF